MKRILEGLTFILIGFVLVVSGSLLNVADVSNRKVTVFDEIRCRKIVIDDDDYREAGKITLEVDASTPRILLEDRAGSIYYDLHIKDGVIMTLGYTDPETGTKINEIQLVADKNNARITTY